MQALALIVGLVISIDFVGCDANMVKSVTSLIESSHVLR